MSVKKRWFHVLLMFVLAAGLVAVPNATVSASVVDTFIVSEDAFVTGATGTNSSQLKISPNDQRISYLKFNVSAVSGTVSSAKLQLRAVQQSGNPNMEVYLASANNWSESTLNGNNAPGLGALIGTYNQHVSANQTIQVNLNTSMISGNGTYTLIVKSTNAHLTFTSKDTSESQYYPRLIVESAANPGGGGGGSPAVSILDDAYLTGSTGTNSSQLKISPNDQRISYMKVQVSNVNGSISSAKLKLTAVQQSGNPNMQVYLGSTNSWSEATLNGGNAPGQGALIGTYNQHVNVNETIFVDLNTSMISGNGTYTIIVKSTNAHLTFASKEVTETQNRPDLIITGGGGTPPPGDNRPGNAPIGACTQYITSGGEHDGTSANPGDVICINAGTYQLLHFMNYEGSPEEPITFVNYGGTVSVHNSSGVGYTVKFSNSQYFRFTGANGSGVPGDKYGIKIGHTTNGISAVHATSKSSDFEMDHLEIYAAGFAGMLLKTDPICTNTDAHQGNWTMKNVILHNNKFDGDNQYAKEAYNGSSFGGEAIYLGNSFYNNGTVPNVGNCGRVYPHNIEGVWIYDNVIDTIGKDGIQVGSATKDVFVHNNYIYNYGTRLEDGHMVGLEINPGTTGHWYNNTIINPVKRGTGVNNKGWGEVYVYNNLIVNPGDIGIFADDRVNNWNPLFNTPGGMYYFNNTIVNPTNFGMDIRHKHSNITENLVYNNIVVHPQEGDMVPVRNIPKRYFTGGGTNLLLSNNYTTKVIGDAKFVSPGSSNWNYRLQSSSPAVNAGMDLSSYGITFDLDENIRPKGSAFDIGAYESH